MIVQDIQLKRNKAYHVFNHVTNDEFYDIQLGYVDSTTAFLVWTPEILFKENVIDTIQLLNPNINKIYTAIWYWDLDYRDKLIDLGFQFVEVSSVGDPGELCFVYEFPV